MAPLLLTSYIRFDVCGELFSIKFCSQEALRHSGHLFFLRYWKENDLRRFTFHTKNHIFVYPNVFRHSLHGIHERIKLFVLVKTKR